MNELFTATYRGSSVTVCETEDGHIYPMGGRHDCNHPDCPAQTPHSPATDLGSLGPIEQMYKSTVGVEPRPLVLALDELRREQK